MFDRVLNYLQYVNLKKLLHEQKANLVVLSLQLSVHVFCNYLVGRRSGVFIINFEHISPCSSVPIVNFEQVNADWVQDTSKPLLVTGKLINDDGIDLEILFTSELPFAVPLFQIIVNKQDEFFDLFLFHNFLSFTRS